MCFSNLLKLQQIEMITIELYELPSGRIITIVAGIDAEQYDLPKIERVLKN